VAASDLPRRADRWEASARVRNPWAWISLACALLGLAAAAAIGAATREVEPLTGLSDEVGYLLYGAVPTFGVLAAAFGVVALGRPRRRWAAVVAIVVGSIEIVAAIVAMVVLLSASRSL
jgi:hypothetical protein